MKKSSACIVLFFILIFWGCDGSNIFGGQVCTLIGCDDGVSISVSEERPDSLSLTLFINDETDPFGSRDCDDPNLGCWFRIGGETPDEVRVLIEWDGGEFSERFEPEYETHQPNGPSCPPTCNIASISIDLSED